MTDTTPPSCCSPGRRESDDLSGTVSGVHDARKKRAERERWAGQAESAVLRCGERPVGHARGRRRGRHDRRRPLVADPGRRPAPGGQRGARTAAGHPGGWLHGGDRAAVRPGRAAQQAGLVLYEDDDRRFELVHSVLPLTNGDGAPLRVGEFGKEGERPTTTPPTAVADAPRVRGSHLRTRRGCRCPVTSTPSMGSTGYARPPAATGAHRRTSAPGPCRYGRAPDRSRPPREVRRDG